MGCDNLVAPASHARSQVRVGWSSSLQSPRPVSERGGNGGQQNEVAALSRASMHDHDPRVGPGDAPLACRFLTGMRLAASSSALGRNPHVDDDDVFSSFCEKQRHLEQCSADGEDSSPVALSGKHGPGASASIEIWCRRRQTSASSGPSGRCWPLRANCEPITASVTYEQ